MIQYQHMKVPVATEGLGRKKRELAALEHSYAKLDDRGIQDLFEFVKKYSGLLRYVDPCGKEQGTWESFFEKMPEKDGKCSPHLALLIAFFKLFRFSQQSLNEVIKRHLDYYYLDTLKLKKKTPKPDIAHAILELSEQVNSYHLKEGTVFLAGKDGKGDDRLYKLTNSTQLTQAKVTSVRSLFLKHVDQELTENGETKRIQRIAGICGEEVWSPDNPNESWLALGNASLPSTDLGFAVTAPILHLPEGIRTIKLSVLMEYTDDPASLDLDELNQQIGDQFKIQLSKEEGWLAKKADYASISKGKSDIELVLTMQLTLNKSEVPIVALEEDTSLPTAWPVMKVLLDSEGPYEYLLFQKCQFVTIDIDVHVEDVKDIVLQNNESVLSPNAPFYPFTLNPSIDADFYIGSTEIFRKNLTSLDLKLSWHNVPDQQFAAHYAAYDSNINRKNKDFKARVEILKNKDWYHVANVGLFAAENARHSKRLNIQVPGFSLADEFEGISIPNEQEVELEVVEGGNLQIGEAEELDTVESYDIKSQRGFVRMRLSEPDFGHNEYPNLYASTVAKNNLAQDEESFLPLPNQPYTPELKSVSLSYSARKEIDTHNAHSYFFQMHPFGYKRVERSQEDPWLLPQLTGEGHLIVGLKNVQELSEVSLLIQCMEGSADPEAHIPSIQWSYLQDDVWTDFPSSAILYDSSENLNKPGVITLSIPQHLSLDHTILPSDHFWIKASAEESAAGTCKLQKIAAQAVVLEPVRQESTEDSHASLPPDTIQKLQDPIPEVQEVTQPFASILGRGQEKDEEFYQRVAERLKHKNRAFNLWDCERMVLEQFPSIYKVKCFKHTDPYRGFAPGALFMVIIPDVRQQIKEDPLQPMSSLQQRESVQKFLKEHALPFVHVEVRNPLYEPIEMEFMVKFRHGYHNGLYEQQLQDELKKYLAPWAYDEGVEIGLGGKIYKSAILNFVEERPYVDFVTFFKMNQYDQYGNGRMNIEEGFAITPVSVLTSATHHQIRVLDHEDVMCADGIGHMVVEDSFTTIK